MASAPTHVVATSAIAAFFHRPRVPWHLWFAGALLAVAPDLDVIGFRFGVKYADLLGHRGLTHSLLAAAVVSALVVMLFYRSGAGALRAKQVWLPVPVHGVTRRPRRPHEGRPRRRLLRAVQRQAVFLPGPAARRIAAQH